MLNDADDLYETACQERDELKAQLQQATKLLNYALTIRMFGERAPGGNENWREWDMRTEVFLRSLLANTDG